MLSSTTVSLTQPRHVALEVHYEVEHSVVLGYLQLHLAVQVLIVDSTGQFVGVTAVDFDFAS